MKENTTCALLRLSQVEESKAMIRRFDAIPLLVSLLESGGLRAKRDASTMLYSLYMVKENKIKAVKAGIMKVLVELMADFESNMVDKLTYVVCEDFDGEEHCCEDAVDFDADVHVEVVCDGGVLVAKFLLQRNFQVGEGFSSENPSHVAAVDGENAYLAALVLDYGDAVHGGGKGSNPLISKG
ncbi:hypothetical protein JHK87_042470 [Glycine soja]|nr:hypothetical protein JHK87_042470 [Glycine soja]